jgi:phage terminase small subunit
LVDSNRIDDETAGAISEISQSKDGALKVKLHDKQAALVNLGRHLGMFPTKVELTGKGGGPVEVTRIERVIVRTPNPDG